MPKQSELTKSGDITASSSSTGKTVSAVKAYQSGIVTVIELDWSNSTISYIKVRGLEVEVGGTNEFGTGTKVL